MRIVVLNHDYGPFLQQHYAAHPDLREAPYARQHAARMATWFGVADSYSHYLNALGCEAQEIIVNNPWAQRAWARERGLRVPPPWRWGWGRRAGLPWPRRLGNDRWLYTVLAAQLAELRPDVVLSQNLYLDSGEMARMKAHTRLLVGQHAAPLPVGQDLSVYDLIVSSLPNLVEHFRALGVPAVLHRLAFDPRVLAAAPAVERDLELTFVGSIVAAHAGRRRWLEHVAEALPLRVWGRLDADVAAGPLGRCFQGPAWGLEMYRLLRRSQITLNVHIDVAGPHANNLRLYEATGMGACLVTDAQQDLDALFAPGEEVVAAADAPATIAAVEALLATPDRRQQVAAAGQARTLAEHTYAQRMAELLALLQERLS